MDFQDRLARAAQRGAQNREAQRQQAQAAALNAEELKTLHRRNRLELCEHIEACLNQLADQFPGFQVESVVSDKGWGAAASRDDVDLRRGAGRLSSFSRLEILVTPLGAFPVLDVAVKATIRNKEIFAHQYYQQLAEVDLSSFREAIDVWVLQYAEQFAGQ